MASTVEETAEDVRRRKGVWPLVPLRAGDLYEVTIVQTRYGGTYEGGEWAASRGWLPDEAFGGDPVCDEWWTNVAPRVAVGVGSTPDAALAALIGKLEAELTDG